jgi:hypothetical protein
MKWELRKTTGMPETLSIATKQRIRQQMQRQRGKLPSIPESL